MLNNPVLTLSCPNNLRTNGDIVAGTLNVNLSHARDKGVVTIMIIMLGEVHTQVTAPNVLNVINGSAVPCAVYRDKMQIFKKEKVLWTARSLTSRPIRNLGISLIPFSFRVPRIDLPPSFHGGTRRTGGSVQYYLRVVGVRKPWYKMNIRINQAFPFLPVDRSLLSPSELTLSDEWKVYHSSAKLKRGLMTPRCIGYVSSEFYMPRMSRIPLFCSIPIRLRIICRSRLLQQNVSPNPKDFDFPRVPDRTAIELMLREQCAVTAQGYHNNCQANLGAQAGFGTASESGHVKSTTKEPYWVDEGDGQGHWSEEIDFYSAVVFRCPTPFTTPSISTSVYLDLNIRFPGNQNCLSTEIGPLPLTSGISPFETKIGIGKIDFPPSYYDENDKY